MIKQPLSAVLRLLVGCGPLAVVGADAAYSQRAFESGKYFRSIFICGRSRPSIGSIFV